ncbi:MAG TPA: hypothetical protein VNB67_09370 [Nitrososphaeraceae archaeon]|jgi:hypothetical protein|nr:hypothetical protein [Nitrososphaeraceae archaeon]
MTGDTFEKIKKGVKDTAEKITDSAKKVADPDTYTGSDEEKEIKENREYNEAGGKEPMNPDDIAGHEPTAVKRDQDTEIAEGVGNHDVNNSGPNHSLCSWIFHSKFSTAYFLYLLGETYIY